MSPNPQTVTTATMTTNRITSLRELLHYRATEEEYNKIINLGILFDHFVSLCGLKGWAESSVSVTVQIRK